MTQILPIPRISDAKLFGRVAVALGGD